MQSAGSGMIKYSYRKCQKISTAGSGMIKYSHRKCQKISDGDQNKTLIDRLSALPDDIICRILFFLGTKESVTTSILARRWRFLWAYVPRLDFDSDYFNSRTSFSNIINMVMKLHKLQSLDHFRLCEELHEPGWSSEDELKSWITTAIDRNVQFLDLLFDPSRNFKLPQCLFSCKTLVGMGLHCCCIPLVSSGAIHLPNLKKLFLRDVDYEVEEALPHLLSGCPVLEELTVSGIWLLSRCLNISSPTMKTLKVTNYHRSYIFDINAPALTYFEIAMSNENNIFFSSITTSFVEVVIQLISFLFKAQDYFYTRRQVLVFLDSVRNIKRLKVIDTINKVDIEFGVVDSNVRFNNLVGLDLTADSQFLSKFIGCANKHGVLVIHEGYVCLKTLTEPEEEECACLLNSFRTVTIHQFGWTEQELNAIEYILGNARALKSMAIYSRHDDSLGPRRDVIWKILLFHRVSEECVLLFA